MGLGRKWTIIIAVILGLSAVILTNIYLEQSRREIVVEEARILIAARDITKGSVIDYDMLAFKTMPLTFIQPGAFASKEGAVGKTAAITIIAGEQILSSKLAAPETGLTLAGKTPPGKRAITIGLDAASAVGGMVGPGDHVDVLAIFTAPSITVTLFQDILVLAVGQRIVAEAEERRPRREEVLGTGRETVTLALTPQEVQILILATEQGKIRLTLRPRMETGEVLPQVDLTNLPPVIELNTLLQLYIRRPPAEMVEPKAQVEIIRGLKKEVTPVPENNK
ncbi:MAG: Flp pilus assembly protein CpaB [Candidatus Omnitrophota bacterium]|nr:MAG: Flp pilus assembly protein CpaB [Candidatus Omnitrophota bacterium]